MTPMGMGMPITPFMPLIKKPDFPPDVITLFNYQFLDVNGIRYPLDCKCRKIDRKGKM
jgi:hypothetical protein